MDVTTKDQGPSRVEPTQPGQSLRRPLGGRLRAYRPRSTTTTRLETIRKALVRGELSLNSLNRWRLVQPRNYAIGWTFIEAGRTAEVAEREIRMAQRESGRLHVIQADESSAQEIEERIVGGDERPELLVVRRNWVQHPAPHPACVRLLEAARERGLVIHLIAALGPKLITGDELHQQARERWQFTRDPLLRPLPRRSNIERRFGETLAAAGLDPIPQRAVAQYFLDFAVFGNACGLPVKLDIEVDGRYWHEELPGRHRLSDERRNQVLKRLGWRPIRFWTDEIEKHELECVERVRRESASATPIGDLSSTMEKCQ